MLRKNFFKSKLNIIFTFLVVIGFVFGLVSNVWGIACPKFNCDPQDLELLVVKNRTQETNWQDPVSANCGDRIAFQVYYHNCVEGSVAHDTKIRIDYPDQKSTTLTSIAYLWAYDADYVSDTATINVSTPQKIIFDDYAKWYPNQTTQNPTLIPVTRYYRSVEVNIGDIPGGWSSQGYVTFEATITSCDNPTVDIKANGSDSAITIPYNSSATLTWTSSNANTCYATGDWSGTKSLSGSESTGNLTSSKTYTITCTGSGGSASDSVTVNVQSQPTLYVSLSANPSAGCSSLTNVDLTANISGSASGYITYYFDCTNDGSWERVTTESSTSYIAYDLCNYYSPGTYYAKVRTERGGQIAENTTPIYVSSCYTPVVPTVDIKANGSDSAITIPYNSSATLTWTSSNANTCYATGDWSGTKSLSGSESTGNLTSSKTYTITCTGSGGSASDSVTVNVSTLSGLSVSKLVRNLTDNTSWQEEINADPGEFLAFSIQVTTTGNTTLSNVIVKDLLPEKLVYRGNLKIDGVASNGDIITGLNIGSLTPNQTKTITFEAQALGVSHFGYGTTDVINSVSVTSGNISATDTATVKIIKRSVAGAVTTIPTGINLISVGIVSAFLLSVLCWILFIYLENSQNPFVRKLLSIYYRIKMFIMR